VRNRLRRYVNGIGDQRFWRLVTSEWMTTNYVLFLSLLARLWVRALTPTVILSSEDLGPLTLDLLIGYWGDDRLVGYFSQLSEEARWSSAILLTDHHGDALTAAACIRLLESQGDVGRNAPFAVGTYAGVAEGLGLLTEEVVERALIFLDRADESPTPYLQRLLGTGSYFSWDRLAANLAWRHGLRSAALQGDLPGVGRFLSGDVLVVDVGEKATVNESTLQVFGEWVKEVRKRDPRRDTIHMAWGKEMILIYDVTTQELMARHPPTKMGIGLQVIATALLPEDISKLTLNESFSATA
jgi:hypothetical protein